MSSDDAVFEWIMSDIKEVIKNIDKRIGKSEKERAEMIVDYFFSLERNPESFELHGGAHDDLINKMINGTAKGDEIYIFSVLLDSGLIDNDDLNRVYNNHLNSFKDGLTNEENDIINHPDHYTDGPIECFDLICAMEGHERAKGFAIGNCWKYLYRHGRKGKDAEDIRKMIKYAQFYLQLLEADERDIDAEDDNA